MMVDYVKHPTIPPSFPVKYGYMELSPYVGRHKTIGSPYNFMTRIVRYHSIKYGLLCLSSTCKVFRDISLCFGILHMAKLIQ